MANRQQLLIGVLITTICAVLYNLQYSLVNTLLGRIILLINILLITLYNKFIGLCAIVLFILFYIFVDNRNIYEGLTNPPATTGATGATGSSMPAGPTGASAPTGATGASSPSGPTGSTGASSSPSTSPSTQPGATGATGQQTSTTEGFLNGGFFPTYNMGAKKSSSLTDSAASFEGYTNYYKYTNDGRIDRISAEQNIRAKQSNSMFSTFFNKKQHHPKPSWPRTGSSFILHGDVIKNY
jgi:hypothetical protein